MRSTLRTLLAVWLIVVAPMWLFAEQSKVKSPDGRLVVNVEDQEGRLFYEVFYDGRQMMLPSALGAVANVGNFAQDLHYKDVKRQKIESDYTMRTTKTSLVHYRANEMAVTYVNAQKLPLVVRFRVSDNDIAFRYEFGEVNDRTHIIVEREHTAFRLPTVTTTFLSPQSDPMTGWKRTKPSYEEEYTPDAPMNAKSRYGQGYTFPCLFRVGEDGWERMFPNYVSSEAVLASENVFFLEHHAKREGFELTMHPFCRNAVAAMDWGGTIMNRYLSRDNKSRHRRYTSDVFEMAAAIVNQASINCIAIYPNNLTELPQHEIDFLKGVPTTWDETRFVDGYPGKYAVIARRHGNSWYVAALNGTDKALTLTLQLPMLAGQQVDYYYETADKQSLWPKSAIRQTKVGKDGKMKINMQPMGGSIICK